MRARHLQEDRLFDCYLAERGGEPIDPPSAEHLADCAECAARYGGLARFMDEVRSEADAELDDVFTPEHLRAAQQQIARRLEHLGHAARVISFPGHPATQQHADRTSRLSRRWIAGAAAAGLFFGIYVGSGLVGPIRRGPWLQGTPIARSAPQTMHVAQPAVLRSDAEPAAVAAADNDAYDEFLQELELAGDRPHTPELIALDDLTPHVRSVQAGLR
jgi:hypothetical protein